MRKIIIGDIHGCSDEFSRLVKLCDYKKGRDRLVLAGDLLDRGYDEVGVVKLAIELGAECVMGNHDEKHVRYAKKKEIHGDSRIGLSKEQKELWNKFSIEQRQWLSSLPDYINIGDNVYVVHAGVLPGKKVEEQPQRVLMRCRYIDLIQDKHDAKLFRWEMARMRMEGNSFLRPKGSVFWSEPYSMWESGVTIIYGHNSFVDGPRVDVFKEINRKTASIGVDTGSVFGCKLTAVVFENDVDEHEFVSVQSTYSCNDELFSEGEYDR